MNRLYLMILFLLAPKVLVADDNINGVTLCSLRNYVDLFVQLEGVKNSINAFVETGAEPKTNILKIHSILSDLEDLKRSGYELLPMSAKEIFEKNFLILARREKIIVCFFDMSQDRKLEILAPDWVQFDPYKGLVLNNMHQFTNLQTSTLMKLLSDYVGEGSYRVSDSKMAVSSEDGKMEDLKITFIGHGIGGCSAQFMALHIKYMHPDMNDDHLNVITLGSELCFDASVAEFYNQRLKAFTLNILHKNDPISNFQIVAGSNLRQVGTFVLTPDPENNRHKLRGYHESLYLLVSDDYRIYEPQ